MLLSIGETLSKGIVNVGKSERNLGSTFVQFSRFKKITDFVISPFPYSRLTKIGLSKFLQPRVQEEKRLDNLSSQTKITYQNFLNLN